MSLTLVVNGANVNATDINQIINVLQQPSGGQETGHYWSGGNGYTGSSTLSFYVTSLSRNATPVSVSVDQTDQAASGCAAPSTNHLTQGGFQVYTTSTGAQTNANVGGAYTIQY